MYDLCKENRKENAAGRKEWLAWSFRLCADQSFCWLLVADGRLEWWVLYGVNRLWYRTIAQRVKSWRMELLFWIARRRLVGDNRQRDSHLASPSSCIDSPVHVSIIACCAVAVWSFSTLNVTTCAIYPRSSTMSLAIFKAVYWCTIDRALMRSVMARSGWFDPSWINYRNSSWSCGWAGLVICRSFMLYEYDAFAEQLHTLAKARVRHKQV